MSGPGMVEIPIEPTEAILQDLFDALAGETDPLPPEELLRRLYAVIVAHGRE